MQMQGTCKTTVKQSEPIDSTVAPQPDVPLGPRLAFGKMVLHCKNRPVDRTYPRTLRNVAYGKLATAHLSYLGPKAYLANLYTSRPTQGGLCTSYLCMYVLGVVAIAGLGGAHPEGDSTPADEKPWRPPNPTDLGQKANHGAIPTLQNLGLNGWT